MKYIPKKIHYCWFGKQIKPDYIKNYIKTWGKNEGYEVIEWNETNFNVKECKFVEEAYKNKKWAFVSDYVRLSVLYKYGGVYLDTDVEIVKSFDELLKKEMFLGYIYNASIGTAVIGAKKEHKIIGELLSFYKEAIYSYEGNKSILKFKEFQNYQINNNNDLFTIYFMNRVEGFLLSNRKQELNGLTIYPKEAFERRTFNNKENFSIHHCYGSWYKENPYKRSKKAKFINSIVGDIVYDKLLSNIKLRKLPYYERYRSDMKKYREK